MTVEAAPRIIELRAPQAMQHAHTYGTNGIILELEIALAPALEWDEYLIALRDADAAFVCAETIAHTPGIIKRETALFDASVATYFKKLAPHLETGEHAVIAVLSSANRETLAQIVNESGGRIAFQQTGAAAKTTQHTLLEYCWNHTTLHALRSDKSLTYLQTTYAYGREREQLALLSRRAGDVILNHLEFIRDARGRVICSGLPLIRFTDEDQLRELMALHRECGVGVKDPHVYTLEDGSGHGAMSPASWEAKRRFDPAGLLNPGKLRGNR